jgi:DNA primase
MKMTARTDISELKVKNPIDAILADRGYYPVKVSVDQLLYNSPFRKEGSPSFHVDLEKSPGGVWFDFGSGKGGDVITLIQELDGASFKDAVQYLRDRRS